MQRSSSIFAGRLFDTQLILVSYVLCHAFLSAVLCPFHYLLFLYTTGFSIRALSLTPLLPLVMAGEVRRGPDWQHCL